MPLFDVTWGYILKTRRENGGDLAVPVEAAEQALLHLRSTMGEDVGALPERVLTTLLNWAPWTYRWLTWLSNSIARVERVDGFDGLRQRLSDPSKFEEAYSVLQAADSLIAANLAICFDIPVQVGLRLKKPDIQVMDAETGVSFYCEVSVSYTAQGHAAQSQFLSAIHTTLVHRTVPLAFAGKLLRSIAVEEVEGLINRIRWELVEIENDSSFHEIDIDGALQLAVAPAALGGRVSEWARQHGLELNSLSAALPATDHIERLRRKIEEESRQLPAGQPNIVVILAQDLFMDAGDPADLIPIALEIVSEHRMIAVLVLTCEKFHAVTPSKTKVGDSLYAASDRDGLMHEQILVINPSCPETFPVSTLEKLYAAFAH
jgi:hypothetical protein